MPSHLAKPLIKVKYEPSMNGKLWRQISSAVSFIFFTANIRHGLYCLPGPKLLITDSMLDHRTIP